MGLRPAQPLGIAADHGAARARASSPPVQGTPGPFALADPERVRELLQQAGFADIDVQTLQVEQRHPSFDAFWETTLDIARIFHDTVLSRPEPEIVEIRCRARGRGWNPSPNPTGRSRSPGARSSPPRPSRLSRIASRPMLYDDDADLTLLDGKTVAIIGYGSQGHAHALNLKDSGVNVVVGLREDSASVAQAREHGLEVLPVVDAASRGDLVMILLPDERHHDVWESDIRDGIAEGNMILFGHGFSIHYGEIEPPARRRRRDGRPQGPRPPRPPPVHRGQRRPRPDRHRPGRDRQRARRSRSPTPRASAAPAAA